MLDANEAAATAKTMWRKHFAEMPQLETIHGYLKGERGRPSLPEDADDEIRELQRISVKNIMPLVVDTFTDALSVVGFRAADAEVDEQAWEIWQRERMDARQSEVHYPAIAYGASYLLLDLGDDGLVRWNPRSPRRMFAAYEDPSRDEWPMFALETWMEKGLGGTRVRRARLWDADASYDVTVHGSSDSSRVSVADDWAPVPHPFGVCPVVRFVNSYDAEVDSHGEVEPLIPDQKALNAVNFDRMVVSRFGAFPQKYIMGWAANSSEEAQRMGARRVLTFEDEEVKAGAFPAADVTAYNEIIEEMLGYIAAKARVQVHAFTAQISNVGTDTIALIDSPNQRKTGRKRASFGESWEQALRKSAEVEGTDIPATAEVVWLDTEALSFASAVDGIVKLTTAGVPIEALVDQIPGLTQQKADAILAAIDRAAASGLAARIITAAREPEPIPTAEVA